MADGRAKNGGRRPGAGRPPGIPSKRTQMLADEVKARLGIEGKKLPLDIMLEAIELKYEAEGALAAFELAAAAAPYLHPKLSSVDASLTGSLVVERVTFGAVIDAADERPALTDAGIRH